MVNYQQAKIYQIVPTCEHEEGDVYIGSTCKALLSQRIANHRTEYRAGRRQTRSKILFDKYGLDNCIIELIETYPCNSKDELLKREGEYIRQTPCVNRCVAGRTKMEQCKIYAEKNKEYIKEYNKKYYQENKSKYIAVKTPLNYC